MKVQFKKPMSDTAVVKINILLVLD